MSTVTNTQNPNSQSPSSTGCGSSYYDEMWTVIQMQSSLTELETEATKTEEDIATQQSNIEQSFQAALEATTEELDQEQAKQEKEQKKHRGVKGFFVSAWDGTKDIVKETADLNKLANEAMIGETKDAQSTLKEMKSTGMDLLQNAPALISCLSILASALMGPAAMVLISIALTYVSQTTTLMQSGLDGLQKLGKDMGIHSEKDQAIFADAVFMVGMAVACGAASALFSSAVASSLADTAESLLSSVKSCFSSPILEEVGGGDVEMGVLGDNAGNGAHGVADDAGQGEVEEKNQSAWNRFKQGFYLGGAASIGMSQLAIDLVKVIPTHDTALKIALVSIFEAVLMLAAFTMGYMAYAGQGIESASVQIQQIGMKIQALASLMGGSVGIASGLVSIQMGNIQAKSEELQGDISILSSGEELGNSTLNSIQSTTSFLWQEYQAMNSGFAEDVSAVALTTSQILA